MKKILFSLFLFMTILSFHQITIAANEASVAQYQVKIEPISKNASKVKAQSIHGTDVAVINYTDYSINVNYSNYYNFTLTRNTSGRITSNVQQQLPIALSNMNGQEFFRGVVSNYATLSVYVSNGQYVVYVTNNP